MFASEPVGGKSRATELPCCTWCLQCDEVFIILHQTIPRIPQKIIKYSSDYFHILASDFFCENQLISLPDSFVLQNSHGFYNISYKPLLHFKAVFKLYFYLAKMLYAQICKKYVYYMFTILYMFNTIGWLILYIYILGCGWQGSWFWLSLW